jgi:alpha-mannosidase
MAEHPNRPLSLVFWGVGDHGGGPSQGDLADLTALIDETGDVEILHSTPESYFAELRASRTAEDGALDLPRHGSDINPWAVGCYTSQIQIKQRHRQLENLLYMTEKMASVAAMQGLMAYPKADLDAAQRDLLFAEFHDILPGSSIQAVERTSLRLLDHGLEIVSRLRAQAFFALAQGQPRAAEGEIPILVYNPHPYPVRTTVVCEFQLADQNWEDTFTQVTVMRDGDVLPTQVEKEVSNLNMDWRKRVVFDAELAPSQMNRFDCRLQLLPQKPAISLSAEDGAIHIETADLDVLINTETGLLDRYQVQGVDYLQSGAMAALVIEDNEDPWGMQVKSFREVVGSFRLMTPEESATFSGVRQDTLPPVRVIEDGPVRTVVEAVFTYQRSALCLRYLVPKQGTELGLTVRVLWNEKDRMLKLALPTALGEARYLGQVAYGVGALPNDGREAVAQKWVAVVDDAGDRSLTCINDGIYGSDFADGALRFSLLRSSVYAGHPIRERPVVPQDRFTPRIDQGERLYRFWINAGPVAARRAAVDREALAHNEAPFALSFFPHGEGVQPKPGPVVTGDSVQITAVKPAEDGQGTIVRLYEPTGQAQMTTLTVPVLDLSTEVELTSYEVKTLRLHAGTAAEVDLTEAES